MRFAGLVAGVTAIFLGGGPGVAAPSLQAMLSYPYEDLLTAAPNGRAVAWMENLAGARNIWVARAPGFAPRQVTHTNLDDGQELSHLTFSPDGSHLVWVRGGNDDENWPAEGGLEPDAASMPETPATRLWSVEVAGGEPVKIGDGNAPAVSSRGALAYVHDHQVWTAPLDGGGKAERLFFDRGKDRALAWSPDGSALAFVSDRGDHAFVGVYTGKDRPIVYLAPSTGKDDLPVWSPDGRRIAFVRGRGDGGAPEPILMEVPHPWSIWVADAATGAGRMVWRSPDTLAGSYPDFGANLIWGAGDRLVFLAETDGWPHLYSVPAAGGDAVRLTTGDYMVETAAPTPDHGRVVCVANTGGPGDSERRHIFSVAVTGGPPTAATSGEGLEWLAGPLEGGRVAFIAAGAKAPPTIAIASLQGAERRILRAAPAGDFPADALVVPRPVTFLAPDGVTVHGELFAASEGPARKTGVVFIHGGPPRQMLQGWHYMDYYSNAYAVNQYLALHGYVVLAVNYRLGIGYGRAFSHPEHAGPAGAAEYQDVAAAGRYLQGLHEVDPTRTGLWGGSYGGYLTAMGLARDSALFKVGVDLHGVHDWTAEREFGTAPKRYEQGDRQAALGVAWTSSPISDMSRWTSPVLLIQGDDDRNVDFSQTVDLARRLEADHIPFEELVLPNEVHMFLRHDSWLRADTATVEFLDRHLKPDAR